MHTLTSNIRFIGAEDDNLDLFEAQYPLTNGISYNSYFIDDMHPAIVDSVDVRRCDDWLASLEEAIHTTGQIPEYLIVQHMEPDHSGSIRALMERYADIKIVCTAKAAAMISNFFEGLDTTARCNIVSDGDTLSLGRSTLRFISAPMVHWPEVMMTLCEPEGILFSADAFGSFAMSTSTEAWPAEARRYYTNIVGRFGPSVQTVMKKLTSLSFNTVAPLHGPVLTGDLAPYWHLYDKWSTYTPETRGVLVAYASVYGGTAEAARRLAAMLETADAGEVVLLDLCRHDVSYAVAEAFRLSHLALCSVTYDSALFPAMHNFLHHIEAKRLRQRRVGIIENGSWAPMAGRLISDALARMADMTVVAPPVTIKSRLHEDNIPALRAFAQALAED